MMNGSDGQRAQSWVGREAYGNMRLGATQQCLCVVCVYSGRNDNRDEPRQAGDYIRVPNTPCFHTATHGFYICMHPQLQWNASGAALGEEVFSPPRSKTPLWTWELGVREEAMAQNSRWEIQEQAGRNIVNDKPRLCFMLGLLVIFRFQPCPENLDLQSC